MRPSPKSSVRRATSLLTLTNDDKTKPAKIANYAWSIVDFGGGRKYQLMESLIKDDMKLYYTSAWQPKDISRLFTAAAKVNYNSKTFNKATAKRIFKSSYREWFDVSSACKTLVALVQMRKTDPELHESIAKTLFTEKKLNIGYESDKLAMAVSLEAMGYPIAMHLVKNVLPSSSRKWVKLSRENDLSSLLMAMMRTKHLTKIPRDLIHHSLVRLMELDTVRLLSPKTLGLTAFAISRMPDSIEDKQFAVQSLGKKLLSHYEKRYSVTNLPQPLLNMIYAYGKLNLSIELATDLVRLLSGVLGMLSNLPTDAKVKTIWSIAVMTSQQLSTTLLLPSEFEHIVSDLIANITSVEEAERLKSGQVVKLYYSFVKLKYDNQFHIECLGSTIRENPRLIDSMNAHSIADLMLSLSKLRLYSEVDIISDCMKRFVITSHTAPDHIITSNVFQSLGVFTSVLSPQERIAYGKLLISRLANNTDQLQRDVVCKMVWGIARLKLVVGPQLTRRLHQELERVNGLNDYQKNQVEQWKTHSSEMKKYNKNPIVQKETSQTRLVNPPVDRQLEFQGSRYLKISEDNRW